MSGRKVRGDVSEVSCAGVVEEYQRLVLAR